MITDLFIFRTGAPTPKATPYFLIPAAGACPCREFGRGQEFLPSVFIHAGTSLFRNISLNFEG